jgi:hypothetical protein
MIDCGRCEMRGTGCRYCAIAVVESRNVTGYLGEAELRALGVLADAGLVPPLPFTIAGAATGPEGAELAPKGTAGLPWHQSPVMVAYRLRSRR